MANVSARVSGLIEQAPFQEGAIVHKDDVLFVIDPRPFQADVDSKQAAVAQAQAQADQAAVHLKRYAKVEGTRAISADDYDAARASNEVAQAQLAAANAALKNSELYLDWTKVTARITGRVGKMNVQVGNLVNGGNANGQATMLTTIVSIDPIYCYVQIPETAAVRYQKLALAEKGSDIAHARIPCYLQLGGESGFPHAGVINFVDNQVDTATGTVMIRGVFSNPQGLLIPGAFARMRVPGSGLHNAILIPDAALNADQNERFVLIVGKDDTVRHQPVELGPTFGDLRQITAGVKPGERIVVSGVQQARPGAKVVPREVPVPTKSLDDLEATDRNLPSTTQPASTQPDHEASAMVGTTRGGLEQARLGGSLALPELHGSPGGKVP